LPEAPAFVVCAGCDIGIGRRRWRGRQSRQAGDDQAQKIHEKCLSLSPPQKLQYSFGTDKVVDFDIHYHKGDMVYYPVTEKKTTSNEGLYTPPSRENYCMAWENRSPSVEVQLEFNFKIIQ